MSGIKIGIGFGLSRLGMPDPGTIVTYAERAEDLGIDSIWLSDHIVGREPSLDIACVMALFAARTRRIKMGPSVLTLPARDPVQVAKTYATLDYLTGSSGRIIMAVGLGRDPRQCLAAGIPPAERAGRLEEGVAVMRRVWTEDSVTHEGRYYRFKDVTITPRPARGALDVWIGGNTDAALRRVARYGDGWFPSFVTPDEFRTGLARLAAYGAEHGRTIDPREAGVVILTHVTDDRSRAQAMAQALAARFPNAPEAFLGRVAIGSVSECVERVRAFVEAGCTKFVLFPLAAPEDLVPQIETYGRDVLPHFA